MSDYHHFGSRRLATRGEGRWHTTAPHGQFAYLEYTLDDITYSPSTGR